MQPKDVEVIGHIDETLKGYWADQLSNSERAAEYARAQLREIEDHEMALQSLVNETVRIRNEQNGF